MTIFKFCILILIITGCTPVNKLLNKGEDELLNGNYAKAESYFKKAYQLDSNSFYTNYWLGTTLSEKMGKHESAFSYLKKAEQLSPKDTIPNLFNALGLTYQYYEDYDNAILNFSKMSRYQLNSEDYKLLDQETKKHIADCNYAKNNSKSKPLKEVYSVNLGSKINSSNPEYVPVVLPNNDLVFTSKRQDSPEEKYNPRDGKFYESMYLSKFDNNSYGGPKLYSIPDSYLKSKTNKENESVVSLSADGKTLFIYRNGKIYESAVNNQTNSPDKLSKNVNFNYYQSHAFLSKDGKTLYFTSEEGKNGLGGNDIYKSVKNTDNTWSEPENLGNVINTAFDEDAPFLSEDGKTLYFSSKGHEGFGGYDIYKSEFDGTTWLKPVNLGMPLNSSGHDIFYIINSYDSTAYYSSNKRGGKGDMDIYKVIFNINTDKECSETNSSLINIAINDKPENVLTKEISFTLPENLTKNIIDFSWWITDLKNLPKEKVFEYTFENNQTRTLNLKLVLGCDTCIEPSVLCKQTQINFKKEDVLVSNTNTENNSKDNLSNNNNNNNATSNTTNTSGTATVSNPSVKIKLNPIYFDFNSSLIREDMTSSLNEITEILKSNTSIRVNLYGHTDSRGNDTFNKNLSYKRAKSVSNYLLNKGVNKKQIINIYAKGETQLANDCKNDDCEEQLHEKNRRVEFIMAD